MKNRIAAILCVSALSVLVVASTGCGSDKTKVVTSTGANGQVQTTTVPDVKFAKTKFILHAGLAFGAIKRWIYNPWKAGTFKSGAEGRTKALVKAAAAGAFAVTQLNSAKKAAMSDEKLRGLVEKIQGLTGNVQGLLPGLKSGSFDPTQISGLAGQLGGISGMAGGLGATIKELNPSIPGG